MKVRKIMTTDVGACHAAENLSKAVELMRQRDCGAIPVIDDESRLIGMITDRDAAVAALSQNRKLSQIKVAEVIGKRVFICRESDDAEEALKKMKRVKVRRLAVVDDKGSLTGIISIADFVLKAPKLKKKIFSALAAIVKPRPIVLREIIDEGGKTPKDQRSINR